MKKLLSAVLAVVMLASTCALCSLSSLGVSAETSAVVVDGTAAWEYIRYDKTDDVSFADLVAPEGWLDGTDTSDEWIDTTLPQGGDWAWQYYKAFVRTSFTLQDPEAIGKMSMKINYDEDPIVYLNGEKIWSATGYSVATVDLSSYVHLLKETNYLCVEYVNAYGGAALDVSLTMMPVRDANGYLLALGATCENVYSFGDLNKPENVLDFNNDTVCGSSFNAENNQAVTVTYPAVYDIGEIFVDCKNEGSTSHEDGVTRGTYDIYARYLGVWSKIASDVKAQPDGVTVKLEEAYKADAIKVVITSWQGTNWACVADFGAKEAAEGTPYASEDLDGKPVVHAASCNGFSGFGSINAPENVLDGKNDSVCGSGYDANAEQSVTLTFAGEATVGSVYLSCKNEGAPETGCWGTYDLYVIDGEFTYKIAEGVEAWPEGRTVTLAKSYRADQIKAVITTWNGSAWAAIAEFHAGGAKEGTPLASRDLNGTPIIEDYEEKLTGDYGDVNAVKNMFDGKENTMWGTNWNADQEISVLVNYQGTVMVESIELYAMNENNAPADGGAWGKYDVYVIADGETVLVAEGVEAWPKEYEGAPENAGLVTLAEPMKVEGVKVVVSEWNVPQWAGIATMNVNTTLPVGDIDGDLNLSISDVTKLLNVIAGIPTTVERDAVLDLDGSENVSISDVTELLTLLATE